MDTSGDWKPCCNHHVIDAKCANTIYTVHHAWLCPRLGPVIDRPICERLGIQAHCHCKTFLLVCKHCAYFVDPSLEWCLHSWMIDWCLDHWLFLDLGPRSIDNSLINALLLNSCFDFLASYMSFSYNFHRGHQVHTSAIPIVGRLASSKGMSPWLSDSAREKINCYAISTVL